MKTALYIFAILFFSFVNAQEQNKTSKFSADLKFQIVTGIGDKFYKDSFKTSPGIVFGFQYKVSQKFGFLFDIRNNFLSIKKPEVYGNFTNINMLNYNFGGFYYKNLNEKLTLTAKVLIGGIQISGNVADNDSKYSQDGTTFGLGSDLVYHIDKKGTIDIIGGLDYQYLQTKININNVYYDKYYSNSAIISSNIGLRFNF